MSAGHSALARTGPAGDLGSAVHRLDPRVKLLGLLGVTVVALSAPLAAWPVWLACGAVLATIAVAARVPAVEIARRMAVVAPLVLLVVAFLPFLDRGGPPVDLGPLAVSEAALAVVAAAASKALVGTFSAVILGATTSFPDVVRALEALRVPRLLVLIALLTYRYAFVLVGEVSRMRRALVARGGGPRHVLAAGSLGRLAAALFLRAHARGERVHLAMLSRGFDGRLPAAAPMALRRAELAFAAAVVCALVPLRVALEAG